MCTEETHNTLKFASRAKRVKQNAMVNEVMDDAARLQKYKHEIADLKQQLEIAKQQAATTGEVQAKSKL